MEPSRKALDRYELRRVLARTATGLVHEGWDSRIARKVAIKTVTLPHAADPELADKLGRFKREAQAAGRLQHPNIVGIYDYGEADDLAFIVMEFVDGVSLKALFDRHERFETPTILRVMGGVLAGLQYSHERGIIHRDIKPSNIMLTGDGRAKIADFGIARIESSSLTQAGTVMGTPAYMSPEQFLGETVDVRTDVYSAGVVLYQMLTGERPYDGGVATIMHKVLHTEAVKPSQLSTQSSPALDAVVTQAMAKRREDRFPTAAAFSEALQGAVDATVIARPPIAPRVERPRPSAPRATAPRPAARAVPPARRRPTRTLAGALLAALLVLGGVGGGAVWLTRGEAPAPPLVPQPEPAPVATPSAAPVVQPPVLAPAQESAVTAPPAPTESQPGPQAEARTALASPEAVDPSVRTALPGAAPPQAEPPATAGPPTPRLPTPPLREASPPRPGPASESRSAFWMPTPAAPDAAQPTRPAARTAPHPRQPRADAVLSKQSLRPPVAAPAERPTPWIGLHVRPVSREDAAALGLGGPAGVLVTGVDSGGPAARASLRANDVLTAFNGTQLSDSGSLDRAVQQSTIGEPASVESWRD
ncbi:MAG: protein kinase, partial [Acetobacteraceae bacterium]|nr:protein kinase [Acetobacteraceae bacterium]